MRVKRIDIDKFRGINSTSLSDCGNLNVLIGKNNSGKSTILDAIDSFFSVVSSKSIVTFGPTNSYNDREALGRESNFPRTDDENDPIRIAVELSLEKGELEALVGDVVNEAPQMRHALDGVDERHLLKIEVSSLRHIPPFAYISRIALVQPGDAEGGIRDRTLLGVSSTAALEILEREKSRSSSENRAREIIEFGRRVDAEDFQMLRRESRDRSPSAVRIHRRLMTSNPEIAYEIESLLRDSESYPEFRNQLDLMAESTRGPARRAAKEPLNSSVDTFSGESHEIPNYASLILDRVSAITVLHLRDRREPVGKEEAKRLLSLKTRRKGPEVLRNIQDTVHSLLGVSIDAFESEKASPGESRAEMDVDEILVEMNGAGIREALRLILDNELGSPKLLLVEEPEVHLHPALEVSMLRYLKAASTRAQVFVTTHSTNFLDTTEMRNVYLTRRDPWVTASLLDYEQAESAIPEELGLRLSSLFMYDRLVFVEGSSDEAILRELASTVGVNLGQCNVGFAVMGSARNFTHYASAATIGMLTRRQVKMFFVLDRDEASDEEVERLSHRLQGLAEIYVLKRREIENYLTVPRALVQLIAEKRLSRGLSSDNINEQAVHQELTKSADELKDLSVHKRVVRRLASPIYFDRSRVFDGTAIDGQLESHIENEIKRQIAELESNLTRISDLISSEVDGILQGWESKKLEIVPGDELLDSVCQKFEVRYQKRRDGGRLARMLQPGEVPQELALLLKKLIA